MDTAEWIDRASVDDVTTWPTKEDLRNQLQVTDRTIERWGVKGKLRSVQRRVPGEKSRPCYHPDDVRVLMGDVVPVVPVAPTVPAITQPSTPTFPAIPDRSDNMPQVNEIKELALSLLSPRVALSEKSYLSLDEASAVSGLSPDHLKELAHKGKLVALRGKGTRGRWKFPTAAVRAISPQDLVNCGILRFEEIVKED